MADEDKAKQLYAAFASIQAGISQIILSIGDAKGFIGAMEKQIIELQAGFNDLDIGTRALIAEFGQNLQLVESEYQSAISRVKEDARNELQAAVADAIHQTRAEMEDSILKEKEDVARKMTSLKILATALTQGKDRDESSEQHSGTDSMALVKIEQTPVSSVQTEEPRLSEAQSVISFDTICKELSQHSSGYLRTLNQEYRPELHIVSNMLKSHDLCFSLVYGAHELTQDEAQDLIKTFVGEDISATTVLVVQKAFRLLGQGQFHIEYRALPKFIASVDASLKELRTQNGYVGNEALLDLVKTGIERQVWIRNIRHGWEQKPNPAGVLPTAAAESRAAFEKVVPKRCLNGLRALRPDEFPDPEKFKVVRRNVGLCCRCKECRKGLGLAVER